MKNLFLLIAFLSLSVTFSQSPDGMVKIDQDNKYSESANQAMVMTDAAYDSKIQSLTERPRLDSFNSEYVESDPDIDTIVTNFWIRKIDENSIEIQVKNRFYEVSLPIFNPFNYELKRDREYRIAIEVDKNLIYEYQTRGQSKVIPARGIWITVSNYQLQRDQMQLTKVTEPGYDRSPRY